MQATDEAYQKRKDQIFCKISCRNSYNNLMYQLKIRPYKKIIEGIKRNDEIISDLKYKYYRCFKYIDLYKLGVDFKYAHGVTYNLVKRKVSTAKFGKYQIILEDCGYKIYKI